LISFGLKAQKKLKRVIFTQGISLVQLNSANCFKVEVHTGQGNEVVIEAEIEGEYTQDLDLKVNTNGTAILIEAGFVPSFENPNDKLSAHKVISILLKLTIPKNKDLEIYGTNSRVIINGIYNEVYVALSDGVCQLNEVVGNVSVRTQRGSIGVLTKSAQIEANSKYGKVSLNLIPKGLSVYKLQTVTGNIELIKTK
jgi:hypothetical protein